MRIPYPASVVALVASITACGTDPSESDISELATWDNAAFASQASTFTAELDVTPSASTEDVVIGLSKASASAYTDLAAIVRFGVGGVIDARNGAAYNALATVSNVVGQTYHVRMAVDVPHHTYSVFVTPQGQAEVTLAQSFAFRSEQATVTSLANRAKIGDPGDVTIANFTVLATPPPIATWINAPFATQTGTAVVSFDAVPSATNLDSVIGLSAGAATSYSQLAAIIRFGDTATIDVRNGSSYGSSASVTYAAGKTYHVRMVVNVPAHVYDVYVTPQGQTEILLAQHFAFRTEQAGVASLASLAAYHSIAPGVTISRFAVTSTGTGTDSVPPSVALTGLASGQTVTPGAPLTLSATASDNVAVTKVEIYAGTTLVCTDTSVPYSCTWTVPSTPGASYAIAAKAYDAAGNVGASPAITVIASGGGSGLTHGKNLTLAMVGPAAIGITSYSASGGSVGISSAGSAPYIQQINQSATYDGVTVSGAHLLVQGVSISGSVDVSSAMPVVIRGCRIRGAGYWSVYARPGAGPVYVLYSDLGGTGIGAASDEVITSGNAGHNVFSRNHISYGGDGFSMGSQNDKVLENYIERFDGSNGAHNDGLQAAGNNNGLLIARNKILLDQGETGAINLGSWGGGLAQYVTIDSNYFAGGGWTFYGGAGQSTPSHDIVVTNNVFGFDFFPNVGYWGPGPAYWDTGNNNVWTNNAKTDGTPVVP